MWKFMRGKGHQPSAERAKLQKELFQFNKTVQHGFPNRPSALAWDPKLKLMGIGTRTGVVKVFGTPGVEFYGEHESECTVLQLFFLPNQGRLISLCDDNTLHLWELNCPDGKPKMEEVKSCSLEGRLKKISTCCLQSNGDNLLIGTEGGNIYLLDVKSFEMTDHIIYQDVVMQNVPDDYKVNPGAVEAIAEHPSDPNKILIGYNRGLMVLWDNKQLNADQTYVGSQQLESVSWQRKGSQFMSAHNDGSYIVWSAADSTKPEQAAHTPYGPFPCKAVNKIDWKSAKRGDFIIFSGGMPRASFGDRHTVTAISGEKHVVFELTSRVIDFFTVSDTTEDHEFDDPHSLVVLAEEEMIVVDLESEDWPCFKPPYLASLHSSAITCAQHCSNVPKEVWDKIVTAGEQQAKDAYSQREWPINGGKNLLADTSTNQDLLLTGHEDGTVRFWNATGVTLSPLYKLTTSNIFSGEDAAEQNAVEEEEWPPFRKVGSFDPYSDDPRLAIKKIVLCTMSGTLVVAGTAGQVVVFNMGETEMDKAMEVSTINIVGDRDSFVWKGHDQLTVKSGALRFASGFQPNSVLQILPPSACTALSLHADWGLVAAGTAYGFGLFDYIQKKQVMVKCTLNPNAPPSGDKDRSDSSSAASDDQSVASSTPSSVGTCSDITGVSENTMSRRKSFKKSLRESFRRLRKGRSQRVGDKKKGAASPRQQSIEEKKESSNKEAPVTDLDAQTPQQQQEQPQAPSPPPAASPDAKPVERQVEARTPDDSFGSMVRCLYLASSFIVSVANTTPTLWAGTNSGAIYVFTVSLPSNEKRKDVQINCQLGKEIQLKHRAPVIAICIIDASNNPLPEPMEVQREVAKQPDNTGSHRVVICSEEQFKVFTLPSLKPYCKFKLTAHEGSRVRKIGFVRFTSRSDAAVSEHCFTCLTNQGDLSIFSIPDLRRQLVHTCIKREDINGISSLVFTRFGEGFFLHSSSELQRFSLSARLVTDVSCELDLPEGVRPAPEPQHEEREIVAPEVAAVPPAIIETDVTKDVPLADADADEAETDDKKEDQQTEVNEVSVLSEDSKKGEESTGDITIDSVKDHLHDKTEDEPSEVNDASILSEDDKSWEESAANTTLDSIKDHLQTSTEESHYTITERREEIKETKEVQESVVTIQTTTILLAETNTNANSNAIVVSED